MNALDPLQWLRWIPSSFQALGIGNHKMFKSQTDDCYIPITLSSSDYKAYQAGAYFAY